MPNSKVNSSGRIAYVDVAKGILICLMLYGHIRVYGPMEGMGDNVMRVMAHTDGVYSAFFMQSFFILTGFCASFKITFNEYLWKNVKTLLLPGLALLLFSEYYKEIAFKGVFTKGPVVSLINYFVTGGHWFILAMFWAKIIYWPIARLSSLWMQIPAVASLYLLGLSLHSLRVTNYQWHQHALLMVPYLLVGVWWREHQELVARWLKPIGLCGIAFILFQHILSECHIFSLPSHDHAICVSFKNFPLHIFNSIVGTAFVIYIAEKLSDDRFLSIMGGYAADLYVEWISLPLNCSRASVFCSSREFHALCTSSCSRAWTLLRGVLWTHPDYLQASCF